MTSEQIEKQEDEAVACLTKPQITRLVYEKPRVCLFLDPIQIQGGSQYISESNSGAIS